ncbi:uncharacterized protein LOC121375791 [Gigantopelta aegis]|uniref:uncharacterized protein LOC121375791 n=1 Tax=Gigantopelta aegis TaxID=1735272 RepID=UPI001B88777A|nr:uncharacterized protein LOC121375791 [Gigantopelta aegis]
MPPTDFRILPCPSIDVTTESFNSTGSAEESVSKDDLNALLYIVVTLLFYSLGIIVGIITYLKREKEEIEEDKCFDEFLQMKRDPFNLHKMEKVHLIAVRLQQIEDIKMAREEQIKKKLQTEVIVEEDNEENSEACVIEDNPQQAVSQASASRPRSLGELECFDNVGKPRKPILRQQSSVFQITPTGEHISSVVAKIFDSERREGLDVPNTQGDTAKHESMETSVDDCDSVSDIRFADLSDSDENSERSPVFTQGRCIVTNV